MLFLQKVPDSTLLVDLVAILTYLAGPSGTLAWMVYASNWFANATKVQEDGTQMISLTGIKLQALVFVVSFGPPTLAFVILQVVPLETLAALQPYYAFVATLFIAYLGQQVWFQIKKGDKPGTVKVSVAGTDTSQTAESGGKSSAAASSSTVNVSVDTKIKPKG